MKTKLLYLLTASFLFCYRSSAQTSATGCYAAYDNAVHTTNVMGTYANMSGRVGLLPGYCSWTPTITSTTCQVCPGNILNSTGECRISSTDTRPLATVTGYLGTFNMVRCPLDDYIWLLILPTGIFGLFYMRKRNLLNLT